MAQEQYINIPYQMLDLDVTPSELLVLALIAGYSRKGLTFTGRISTVAKCGKVTRQGAYWVLNSLLRKGLIVQVEDGYMCQDTLQNVKPLDKNDVKPLDKKCKATLHRVKSLDKKVKSLDTNNIKQSNHNINNQHRQYVPTREEVAYFLHQQKVDNPTSTADDFFQEQNNNGWLTKSGEPIASWKQFLLKAWLPYYNKETPARHITSLEDFKASIR